MPKARLRDCPCANDSFLETEEPTTVPPPLSRSPSPYTGEANVSSLFICITRFKRKPLSDGKDKEEWRTRVSLPLVGEGGTARPAAGTDEVVSARMILYSNKEKRNDAPPLSRPLRAMRRGRGTAASPKCGVGVEGVFENFSRIVKKKKGAQRLLRSFYRIRIRVRGFRRTARR